MFAPVDVVDSACPFGLVDFHVDGRGEGLLNKALVNTQDGMGIE